MKEVLIAGGLSALSLAGLIALYAMTAKHPGGLYLWRTNKPHAFLGLPLLGRHNGYVGMTKSYHLRGVQHLTGSVQYGKAPASWSDLRPKCYRILPLPKIFTHGKYSRKWFMKNLETIAIGLTFPVYNEAQQCPWNLRKMSRNKAAAERARRDEYGQLYKIIKAIGRWILTISVIVISVWIWRSVR